MRVGYACINLTLGRKFRSCRVATAEREGQGVLRTLTIENLKLTKDIIEWNIAQGIRFYRMSSDLVVLSTHPVNKWEWQKDEDVLAICGEIKRLKETHGLRLSMHPGQYSVLNSPRAEVVANTIADLQYHADLMDLTGAGDMILHLGGKYGDPEESLKRLVSETRKLPEGIREKLRFENDDKVFNLRDVLNVCGETGISACFDIHHHFCNPAEEELSALLPELWETWSGKETPKVHISSGREFPLDRRHADYIRPEDFDRLLDALRGKDADVMVEAKMKELAVLKLMEQGFA